MQNYLFVLCISLGAFFFVFIQFLTRAGWSTTVRRVAELIAGNLQWAWVGLVPLVVLWFSGGSHDAAASHAFEGSSVVQTSEVAYVSEASAVTTLAGDDAADGHGDAH